jgi:hypothetical protein
LPNPPLSNDDVENCFSLMSHLTQRTTKENFYEYALSALYLFKLLESTTYFDPLSHLGCAGRDKPNSEDLDEVESDVDGQQESNELDQFKDVVLKLLFVGCLIRSTNTYTIVEDKLHYPDLWDSDRIRLGAGPYMSALLVVVESTPYVQHMTIYVPLPLIISAQSTKTHSQSTPDHLLLDRSPNIGPLKSHGELDKFKDC